MLLSSFETHLFAFSVASLDEPYVRHSLVEEHSHMFLLQIFVLYSEVIVMTQVERKLYYHDTVQLVVALVAYDVCFDNEK